MTTRTFTNHEIHSDDFWNIVADHLESCGVDAELVLRHRSQEAVFSALRKAGRNSRCWREPDGSVTLEIE